MRLESVLIILPFLAADILAVIQNVADHSRYYGNSNSLGRWQDSQLMVPRHHPEPILVSRLDASSTTETFVENETPIDQPRYPSLPPRPKLPVRPPLQLRPVAIKPSEEIQSPIQRPPSAGIPPSESSLPSQSSRLRPTLPLIPRPLPEPILVEKIKLPEPTVEPQPEIPVTIATEPAPIATFYPTPRYPRPILPPRPILRPKPVTVAPIPDILPNNDNEIPIPEPLPDAIPQPIPLPDPFPQPIPRPDPIPQPIPLPDPVPQPIPLPDPIPQPIPLPDPIPQPIPLPDPTPQPIPLPDPVPQPIPLPDPVPQPMPLPDPIPQPIPLPDELPQPNPLPEPEPQPIPLPDPVPPQRKLIPVPRPVPQPLPQPTPAPTRVPLTTTKYPWNTPSQNLRPFPRPTSIPVVPTPKPIPPIPTPKPYDPSRLPTRPNPNQESGILVDYNCGQDGYYSISNECDTYIECKKRSAQKFLCPDGLHFNPNALWPEYPCAYPSEVKCESRAYKQDAQPTEQCPHHYGFFTMNDGDCSRYLSCQEGLATVMNCPPGLVFNSEQSSCDWPGNVPSCKPAIFQGFTCPPVPVDEYGEPYDWIYKYRYGKSCKEYVACQGGHPRLLSCDPGLSFDEVSETCVDSDYVPNCSTY